MVPSLAEELEIDPAAAILHHYQRNDGDATKLVQAVETVKQKEAKL